MWPWILLIIVVIAVFGLGFLFEGLFWVALGLFIFWLITLVVYRFRKS